MESLTAESRREQKGTRMSTPTADGQNAIVRGITEEIERRRNGKAHAEANRLAGRCLWAAVVGGAATSVLVAYDPIAVGIGASIGAAWRARRWRLEQE